MPTFTVFFTGTVIGSCDVEAESMEEAIRIAKSDDFSESIDIEQYPEDWEVDEECTECFSGNPREEEDA